MITITERAVTEIQNIIKKKGIPTEYCLRIGVKGAMGCGGASFFIGFDKEKKTDEKIIVSEISVLIEKRQLLYVVGQQIDFEERENEMGFIFNKVDSFFEKE